MKDEFPTNFCWKTFCKSILSRLLVKDRYSRRASVLYTNLVDKAISLQSSRYCKRLSHTYKEQRALVEIWTLNPLFSLYGGERLGIGCFFFFPSSGVPVVGKHGFSKVSCRLTGLTKQVTRLRLKFVFCSDWRHRQSGSYWVASSRSTQYGGPGVYPSSSSSSSKSTCYEYADC